MNSTGLKLVFLAVIAISVAGFIFYRNRSSRVPSPQAQLVRLVSASRLIPAVPTRANNLAISRGPQPTTKDFTNWTALANDPDLLRRVYAREREKVLIRYSPFLDQMNLPPPKREALIKLLVDMRQASSDVFVADIQKGGDPHQDVEALMDQASLVRAGLNTEIAALLGDDGFAQYQAYFRDQQLVGQIAVLDRIQKSLEGAGNTLTDQQVGHLQELLHGTGHVSPYVLARAKAFLNPQQQQALQAIRDTQLSNETKRQREDFPGLDSN